MAPFAFWAAATRAMTFFTQPSARYGTRLPPLSQESRYLAHVRGTYNDIVTAHPNTTLYDSPMNGPMLPNTSDFPSFLDFYAYAPGADPAGGGWVPHMRKNCRPCSTGRT